MNRTSSLISVDDKPLAKLSARKPGGIFGEYRSRSITVPDSKANSVAVSETNSQFRSTFNRNRETMQELITRKLVAKYLPPLEDLNKQS